jgi:hypothetical protein
MSNGATLPPATALLGHMVEIPGYRLEEQIGRGGMAVVFRAHDERLHRLVALKILMPTPAEYEAFRSRFIRESHAAAAVDDPNIIPVYEAGEASGVLFIAMRLVRGGDLKALVARHGPLSPRRAEWIVSAVASALDAAHACGLVHRDVKPANMLLEARPGRPDHVYLSDFGVSKAALSSGGLTGSGQFLGTIDYAAPEQINGHPVDGHTDQYALGCSAFELLSGRPPFSDKHWLAVIQAQLSQPAPALSSLRPELPATVDGVFARVLAKSPGDRYETCQDFARALRAALGVQPYAVDDLADAAQLKIDSSGDSDATLDPAVFGRRGVMIGSEVASAGASVARPDSVAGASEDSFSTAARAVKVRTVPGRTPMGGRSKAAGSRGRRLGLVVAAILGTVIVLTAAAVIGLALARSPARQQQDLKPVKQASKPVLLQVLVTPPSLRLSVGQSRSLTLRGSMSDGASAPAADLAKAVWTTANPAVARVNTRGEVIAESAGVTRVIVHVGSVRAVAIVTVVAPPTAGLGPVYPYLPQAGQGTSTSPAASPSPTSTTSPTTSPSPTGSSSPPASPSTSPSSAPT